MWSSPGIQVLVAWEHHYPHGICSNHLYTTSMLLVLPLKPTERNLVHFSVPGWLVYYRDQKNLVQDNLVFSALAGKYTYPKWRREEPQQRLGLKQGRSWLRSLYVGWTEGMWREEWKEAIWRSPRSCGCYELLRSEDWDKGSVIPDNG